MKDQRIAIYVPSTVFETAVSDDIFRLRVKNTKVFLSSLFGGFSSFESVHGGWLSDDNNLIEENIIIVSTWTDNKGLFNNIHEVLKYVQKSLVQWSQYSIGLEVIGSFELYDNTTDMLEASIVLSIADFIEV